jgi:hypothetical protein
LLSEPALVVGLIAQLTGSALPKDIVESSRRLVLLGREILGEGPEVDPIGVGTDGQQPGSVQQTNTPSPTTVHLDRSAVSAPGEHR